MGAAALLDAIGAGEAGRVAELLAADPSLRRGRDGKGVSFLLHALYRGASSIVELLRHDALDGFEAAALGDVEALVGCMRRDEMLPLQVNADGFTALHLAAWFGRPNAVRLLLANGADPNAAAENETGIRPLHAAVASGSASAVRQLLLMGAQPDLPRAGGYTALHGAAAHGRIEIVRLLLEAGADKRAVAHDGSTAAGLALRNGHGDLLDLLA